MSITVWSIGHDGSIREFLENTFQGWVNFKFHDQVGAVQSALERGLQSDEVPPALILSEYRFKSSLVTDLLIQAKSRRWGSFRKVVILSRENSEQAICTCLENGAVDYLVFPPDPAMLRAKVLHFTGHSRLVSKVPVEPLFLGGDSHMLYRGERSAQLTVKETAIIRLLIEAADEGLSRNEILRSVWNRVVVGSKTVDVHLFNMRHKLRTLGIEISFDHLRKKYILREL